MRTPVPVGATRRITEPFELGGSMIPSGVPILVNAFGLHHDPVLYPEPEKIRVERFIGASPDGYAYLPFGGGARRCIGSAFALLEMRIVLGAILRKFTLAPTEEQGRLDGPSGNHAGAGERGASAPDQLRRCLNRAPGFSISRVGSRVVDVTGRVLGVSPRRRTGAHGAPRPSGILASVSSSCRTTYGAKTQSLAAALATSRSTARGPRSNG